MVFNLVYVKELKVLCAAGFISYNFQMIVNTVKKKYNNKQI